LCPNPALRAAFSLREEGINGSVANMVSLNTNQISISNDIKLLLLDTISSTNDYLLSEIKNNPNLSSKTVVITERQTQGRGQNQKVWQSPYGKNIYLSYYWQFNSCQDLSGLSLVVALAVNSALQKSNIFDIQLKWPNDIYYESKKLAGILVESILSSDKSTKMVVGIGINVNYAEELEALLGSDKYICLENILGIEVDRNQLISLLIQELFMYMMLFTRHGFSYFKLAWEEMNLLKNKPLTVKSENSASLIHGIMLGVDHTGAMLLKTTDDVLLPIVSGSVVEF
jgi:BirA family biotin operon repressor/biotin-[acetyl-CoA-carboxylase] ligase